MSSVLDMGGYSLRDVKMCCETWVGVSVSGEQLLRELLVVVVVVVLPRDRVLRVSFRLPVHGSLSTVRSPLAFCQSFKGQFGQLFVTTSSTSSLVLG